MICASLSIDWARVLLRSDGAVDKKAQINGWYIVAAVLAVLAIQQWWIVRQQVETIPYSQFEEMIDAHKIESVRVTSEAGLVERICCRPPGQFSDAPRSTRKFRAIPVCGRPGRSGFQDAAGIRQFRPDIG